MSSADHGGHAPLVMIGRHEQGGDRRSECTTIGWTSYPRPSPTVVDNKLPVEVASKSQPSAGSRYLPGSKWPVLDPGWRPGRTG